MQLKSRKFLIYLAGLWLLLITLLGCWWLFLVVKISQELDRNVMRMAKWEGASFILLLAFVSITLVYFYLQDLKKNQSMASFFASLTHELKTPLASMRLQAEVIQETLTHNSSLDRLQILSARLIEDAQRLEDELDNLLQLSRMERGGQLNLDKILLMDFLNDFNRKLGDKVTLSIEGDLSQEIWADEFALGLVLRNLVDNSLKHAHSRRIDIALVQTTRTVQMIYDDGGGQAYKGDPRLLGKLFYKSPNSQGQGIGLYLIKTLMEKMGGQLEIAKAPGLIFYLTFKKYNGGLA